MENKKTSELLDLLTSLVDKEGRLKDGWEEAFEELKSRTPFNEILKSSENDETLQEKVEELEEQVKLLKRHKHDIRTGDVMIRI